MLKINMAISSSVTKLFVIMVYIEVVCCQLPPNQVIRYSKLPLEQVNAMNKVYDIIENDTSPYFRWNDVVKNSSDPCSWHGVGCSSDNSFINHISFNWFSISTSEFLPFLCNITTLESLDVSGNLISSIPDGFFTACGEISGLKVLDLSDNYLNGSLPTFKNGFRVLESLDFSMNSLSGDISLQWDGLGSLKELLLSVNSFTGEIPIEITKCKSLTRIDFSQNKLSGSIPMEFGVFTKLKTLALSYNNLIGGIPSSLSNITTLKTFSARNNKLAGIMPSDMLSGLHFHLRTFDLSSNSLEGPIPVINSTTLQTLVLYNNYLNGTITLGSHLGLKFLDLSNNRLNGRLPPALGNLTNLEYLNVESNDFIGAIPPEILQLNLLEQLKLGGNSLNGSIPVSISRMQSIVYLELKGNNLSGAIPDSIANLSSLARLELGNNRLSGRLPPALGNLTNLDELYLEFNDLVGAIPPEISQLNRLERLKLGGNSLDGSIPVWISTMQSIRLLELQCNKLVGHVPYPIANLSSLETLELGNNQLGGVIPDMAGSLQILNVSYNFLVGRIPQSLAKVSGLQVLDLSNNRLSGDIPYSLTDLSSLTQLLVMNNHLSGLVPMFASRVNVNTMGNKDLFFFRENSSPETPPNKRRKSPSSIFDPEWVIAAASGLPVGLLIALIAIVISRRYKSISRNLSTPNSIHTPNVDFKKAMEAVADPSNITFKTAFSTFYKFVMPSDTTYLVKKVNHTHNLFQLYPQHKQLVEEMEAFGRMSNPNVMIPVAYVLTLRRAYIFYDFARGTLHDILHHKRGNKLEWGSRYSIAVGIAQGLAYLHECSSGPIILLELCSKSILLKSLDEPQISDIEISKLVPSEYGHTRRVTAAGNVYSFGVILLELLTGKPTVNDEETELAKQVLSSSSWDEIVDSSIISSERSAGVRTQMAAVVEVALACLSISPEARPNAVTVVQLLQSKRS